MSPSLRAAPAPSMIRSLLEKRRWWCLRFRSGGAGTGLKGKCQKLTNRHFRLESGNSKNLNPDLNPWNLDFPTSNDGSSIFHICLSLQRAFEKQRGGSQRDHKKD